MAKYYLRLLMLVGSVIAFIALIGSLLPRGYEFSTEVDIEAPVETVFEQFNQISNWRNWSQWNPAEIPELTVEYSGPESGVDATQVWTDVRGSGKLWITTSDPPDQLTYEMLFANFPKMSSLIVLTKNGDTTHVRWTSRGRLPGGPFYGFFAPFFSTHMETEYENSLNRMKKLLE